MSEQDFKLGYQLGMVDLINLQKLDKKNRKLILESIGKAAEQAWADYRKDVGR